MDIVLALSDSSQESYVAARGIVMGMQMASGGRVPISAIAYPRDTLRTARHEMDRFFGRHLTSQDRIVRGNDPATYILYPKALPVTILGSYIAHKKRRLANAYVSGSPLETGDGSGIQRMLELPQAVGRKALHALLDNGYKLRKVRSTADKNEVLHATTALIDRQELRTGFDHLLVLDAYYNQLLDGTLAGEVSQSAYQDGLVKLHEQLPTAIRWLGDIESNLLPKLQ